MKFIHMTDRNEDDVPYNGDTISPRWRLSPCVMCGADTYYQSYNTDQYICSTECHDAYTQE